YQPAGRVVAGGLADGPASGGQWRFLHRCWSGAEYDALRRRADLACPKGPARFSRYLGVCVLRALHRLHGQRPLHTDAYLVTLPTRVRGMAAARPLPGNFRVSTSLCAGREIVDDKPRLLEALAAQVAEFIERGGDRASWAMIWLMGKLRLWQYRMLLAWSVK